MLSPPEPKLAQDGLRYPYLADIIGDGSSCTLPLNTIGNAYTIAQSRNWRLK